mgnify:CR=1 FL=1
MFQLAHAAPQRVAAVQREGLGRPHLFSERRVNLNLNRDALAVDALARNVNAGRTRVGLDHRGDLRARNPEGLFRLGGGEEGNSLFSFASDEAGEGDRGHGEDPFLSADT